MLRTLKRPAPTSDSSSYKEKWPRALKFLPLKMRFTGHCVGCALLCGNPEVNTPELYNHSMAEMLLNLFDLKA